MAERPSGLRLPTKIGKGIPKPASTPTGISDDHHGLNIGDRVLVSGNKSGCLQFLGETKFAPGEWAGIVLEKKEGKNDGSVAGVRYFQCEPLHGIFSRPHKLVKDGSTKISSSGKQVESGDSGGLKIAPLTAASLEALEGPKESKIKQPSKLRSPASSIRSLRFGTSRQPTQTTATPNFSTGDRVVVNGTKYGFARYIGETDFAKGNWVGVELDGPQGKNDGSVLGKRYFTCEILFGLFAPLSKVKKVVPDTPKKARTRHIGKETSSSAVKKSIATGIKSPSSVVSVGSISSLSDVSKSKGIKSEVSSSYGRKTMSSGTSALQEALKEKQQHVESLMAERDIERSDMMQAIQEAAELNKAMEETKIQFQQKMAAKESELDALKGLVEHADVDKVALQREVDEQKAVIGDLLFRLEEEKINKDDLQSEITGIQKNIREMEVSLNIEQNRSQVLQRDLENSRALGVDDKSEVESLRQERDRGLEMVEELSARLAEADLLQQEAVASDVVDALEDRISELLQQIEKMKMQSEENAKISEKNILELQEITSEKLKSNSDEMNTKIQELTDQNSHTQLLLVTAIAEAEAKQKTLEDFQKQIEQLLSSKSALEEENRNIIQLSGDSSSQLNALMENLHKKERLIEQLQSEIRTSATSCKEAEVQKESYETELTTLKASQKISDQQLEDFQNKLTATQSVVDELHTKLKESVTAHEELLLTLTNVNTGKLVVESQLEELGKKYTEIEETLHLSQQERNSFEEKFKNATIECSDLIGRCESIQVQCSSIGIEKQQLSEICQNQLIQINELSESQEKYKRLYEEAKMALTQLREQTEIEKVKLLQQLEEFKEISGRQVVQLAESTKHIDNLLQEKTAVEEEKDAVKNSLEKALETVKGFEENLVSCRKEKDDLEKEFNDSRNTFQELRSTLEHSVTSLKENEIELEEKYGKLEHENKDLLCLKESMKDDLIKANKLVESTGLTLLEAEEKYNTLNGEYTRVQKQFEDSTLQYEKEVDKSKGLHFVVRNLETENSSLQQKLDLMSEEQGGIKQESFQLLDKIQELEVSKAQLESDAGKNIEGMNKLQKEIAALNGEKLAVENLISDVRAELQLSNEKLKITSQMLEQQNEEKGKLLLQLGESEAIIQTKNKELEESLSRTSTFELEISNLKSNLQISSSSDEEQQSKISSLVEEVSILQQDKIRLQSENAELEKVKQEYSHKITSLNNENNDIHKQLLVSNEEFEKSTESILKEGEEKIQGMRNEINELTKNFKQEKETLITANNLIGKLREKNQDILTDLASAKESEAYVRDELSRKCDECEGISMELQSLRETSQGHIEKHHILEKELNEVKEEYIRDKSNLKQEYDVAKQRSDELEEILEEKEKKIDESLSDISKFQLEISDLESKIQVSTCSDTEQQQTIVSLVEEVRTLQEEKNRLQQQNLKLEEVEQEYSDKIALLNGEKREFQKQVLEYDVEFKNNTESIRLKAEVNNHRMHLQMEELQKSLQHEKDIGEQRKKTVEEIEEKNQEFLSNLGIAKESESNIRIELTKKCDEYETMSKEMQTLKENIEFHKKKNSTLQQKLDSLLLEQNQFIVDRDCAKLRLSELEEMLAEKGKAENEHRSKILVLEVDVANSKEDYCKLEEEHKLVTEAHNKLKSQQTKMEKSEMDIGERQVVLKSEFSKERDSLQQTIDITTALLEKKHEETEQYMHEIVILKKENASILTLQESLETLEKEREMLQRELNSMKSSPIAGSSSTEDSGVGTDEEARGQVEFLNSVIVDQQKKISDLSGKISELEAMLLNGEDVDECEIDTEFYESEHKSHAAPRLFCDICDIFDAHDTEDCPTQSMIDDVTSLPQTVHNAAQGEQRSYCDYCEIFGHWTEECTQEEEEMY